MPENTENKLNKPPLVILAGPTAVGKTALSVQLARQIGGEIISADSMQVYKGMDIGSAKVTEAEKQGVPHYLLDVLSPEEDFNVVLFQQMARDAIRQILDHGHIPILAGGTGFYIQAVLYDIDFTENDQGNGIRAALEKEAQEKGSAYMHEKLSSVDPAAAEQIHPNNVKRVIRALEFYQETGDKISGHNEEQHARPCAYNAAYFALNDDRAKIYQRIDRRVDQMMKNGLLEEVKRLRNEGCRRGMVSMQGLGYKELLDYLDGQCTLSEAVEIIKRDSRHFAKRQLTWLRRERNVIWIDREKFENSDQKILTFMCQMLSDRGII